jgi:hypothetical protein
MSSAILASPSMASLCLPGAPVSDVQPALAPGIRHEEVGGFHEVHCQGPRRPGCRRSVGAPFGHSATPSPARTMLRRAAPTRRLIDPIPCRIDVDAGPAAAARACADGGSGQVVRGRRTLSQQGRVSSLREPGQLSGPTVKRISLSRQSIKSAEISFVGSARRVDVLTIRRRCNRYGDHNNCSSDDTFSARAPSSTQRSSPGPNGPPVTR